MLSLEVPGILNSAASRTFYSYLLFLSVFLEFLLSALRILLVHLSLMWEKDVSFWMYMDRTNHIEDVPLLVF